MQGSHKFALVLAAGFMLGAGAIQALHAQAKPPGYLLAEVAVTADEATYKDNEFMKQTLPSVLPLISYNQAFAIESSQQSPAMYLSTRLGSLITRAKTSTHLLLK
jgi:hypothetical protein